MAKHETASPEEESENWPVYEPPPLWYIRPLSIARESEDGR